MPGFRAVGFDLDGTLFDHVGAAQEGLDTFLGTFGLNLTDDMVGYWHSLETKYHELWLAGRVSFQEQRRRRLRDFLPTVGIAVPDSDGALDEVFGRYLVAYRSAWRASPDAIPILRSLRSDGIRIGLLTNGNGHQQRDKLAVTGLLPLVDAVCISEELGFAKPDPRAFEALLEELCVPATETIFIGDSPYFDIEGARAAGMRAGLVVHRRVGLEDAIDRAST